MHHLRANVHVSDEFTQQWSVGQREKVVHMQHKSEIKQSTSLLAVLAEQTKKRPVTVDDETFKKVQIHRKRKKFNVQKKASGLKHCRLKALLTLINSKPHRPTCFNPSSLELIKKILQQINYNMNVTFKADSCRHI